MEDFGNSVPHNFCAVRKDETVAKHKTVTHLPPSAPPPSPAPAPRLVAQLLTAAGDLVVLGACVLGFVTAVGWLIAGAELRSRSAPAHPPRWVCWIDRRYGEEMCEPIPDGRRRR
jgi:hypothetical protein